MGYVKVNMHTRCVPNFASKALDNAITNPSRVEILLNLEGQMDKDTNAVSGSRSIQS